MATIVIFMIRMMLIWTESREEVKHRLIIRKCRDIRASMSVEQYAKLMASY